MKNKKIIFAIIGIVLIVGLILTLSLNKTPEKPVEIEEEIKTEEQTGEVEVVETITEIIRDGEETEEQGDFTYLESPEKDSYSYYDYLEHEKYDLGYVLFEDLEAVNKVDLENNVIYTEIPGISVKTTYIDKTENLDLKNLVETYQKEKIVELESEKIGAWCVNGAIDDVGGIFDASLIEYWTDETNFPKRHIYYYDDLGTYYQVVEINIDYSKNAVDELDNISEELDKVLYLPLMDPEEFSMYLDY